MLKIRYGRIKGHAFLFKYETQTELKLLILQFQNTVDFVFCESLVVWCMDEDDKEGQRVNLRIEKLNVGVNDE